MRKDVAKMLCLVWLRFALMHYQYYKYYLSIGRKKDAYHELSECQFAKQMYKQVRRDFYDTNAGK